MISPMGYTGIAYYDHSLCHHLKLLGVDVTLLTVDRRAVADRSCNYPVVPLFRGTFGDIPRVKKGVAYLKAMLESILFIIRNRIEVVHFQILELPVADLMAFAILRLLNKRIVYTPHDIVSFKSTSMRVVDRMLYRLCDLVIVHNQSNLELLLNEKAKNSRCIKIIAHGNYNLFLHDNLDKPAARRRLDLPADKFIILFFGNIRPGKGLETLLSAYESIPAEKELLLVIVGKPAKNYHIDLPKQDPSLNRQINAVILRDRFIPEELVESYYKSADVIAIPYERAYESGVLRYAFSCSVPAVVSDIREFAEVARDNSTCVTFKAGNSDSLRTRVIQLIRDKQLAERIARNAKAYSDQHWNWEDSARNTLELYTELGKIH